MKNIFETPALAWADFERRVIPTLPRPLAKELYNARYSAQSKPDFPALGWQRVRRLFDKYAPGVYQFAEFCAVVDGV